MNTLSFALVLVAALAAQTGLLLRVTARQVAELGERLDQKIDATSSRLDQKIDAFAAGLDQKIDAVGNGLDQKIDLSYVNIDQRLSALEADMHIIKKHLLHVA